MKKKAYVIQVIHPILNSYDKEEFISLLNAADYELAEYILQKPKKISSHYIISKKKALEIKDRFLNYSELKNDEKIESNYIITFNNRLGATQIQSMEEIFHIRVIDRDLLILDIFERKATTVESKLQIQLASINLQKTQIQKQISQRIKNERQGKDFMGKGYGASTTYKHAQKALTANIIKNLIEIRNRRAIQRKSRKRNNIFNVSIVGYTNAGKTTFLNTLNHIDLKTDDSAFTTVSTVSRRFTYMGDVFVFTDTVGFIYDIPHEIIEAFLSTLEETIFSDCILLLIDITDLKEVIKKKIHTTFYVLSKIGATNIPLVYIFNKIDKIDSRELEEKKEFINQLIPTKSIIFYISAIEKSSLLEVVKMLRMMKKKTIIVNTSQKFAQTLIDSQDADIKAVLTKF